MVPQRLGIQADQWQRPQGFTIVARFACNDEMNDGCIILIHSISCSPVFFNGQ